MESQQTGLLERLRAQRENMQAVTGAPPTLPTTAEEDGPAGESLGAELPMARMGAPNTESTRSAERLPDDAAPRLARLESGQENLGRRLDQMEVNLREGLDALRTELPGLITAEVARQVMPTNETVADLGGRVGRFETEFTRERERWSNVVTSFDQRLDQRLRSFRQDVTVMLTGMAVLILAMLMLILLRR